MSLARGVMIKFFLSIIFLWHFYQLVDSDALSVSAELSPEDLSSSSSSLFSLSKRAGIGAELCQTGVPCKDGSCCGPVGVCGYGPSYCGSGCTSNCNATAMCGKYSVNGQRKCGMNLCCSVYGWCGTDAAHCTVDPTGLSGCQQGFGSCQVFPPPSCSPSGGSSAARTIGYYQGSNLRDRVCNRITPAQINSTGYTHLYYAFASINPSTFAVTPADPADIPLYTQFTALKTPSMQTWIAVGGWDFSNPGPTHTTWSDMTANSANRAAFISSLVSFMKLYGFQGVDLDWEYPAATDRGGNIADTANYVSLVQEMHAVLGSNYGISLTLAPDPGAANGFDAISMQSSVSWFGFMSYDLHGSWDASNAAGSLIRGQTDAREIYNDTFSLWFDGLDPAKINFGLAFYGRGYTVASPSCAYIGCAFTGPSKPAPCTNFAGVMSLVEINAVIAQNSLTPQLLSGPMMKQITWQDQWIGYDDAETLALKRNFANGLCFGGTMAWSVDFNSGSGSGNTPDANLPTTKDGTCGSGFNDTICGSWASGDCCSPHGYCGNTAAFCGNGCQSGNCTVGGISTDGTCGVAYRNSVCGDWANGSCCSAAGYCGNTPAHCGTGCQSGCNNITAPPPSGGSGVVYIDPSIWTSANPVIYCQPPCIFILPPRTLSTATTISFPLFTTSLEVGWLTTRTTTLPGGTISTSSGYARTIETTTITIPPLTTNIINLWNVNFTTSGSSTYTVTSSILPPVLTITDDINPERQTGVTHPAVTRTIHPPPFPYITGRVNPQFPVITIKPGPPGPLCLIGCGSKCLIFCNLPCLICPDAPPGDFSDPNDPNPSGPQDPPTSRPTSTQSSCTTSTVTDFFVSCSPVNPTSSVCTTTSSLLVSGCQITATASTTKAASCTAGSANVNDDQGNDGSIIPPVSTVRTASTLYAPSKSPTTVVPTTVVVTVPASIQTVTIGAPSSTSPRPTSTVIVVVPGTIKTVTVPPHTSITSASASPPDCTHYDQDPGNLIYTDYCVCSGSTFTAPSSVTTVTPANSCPYTTMPTQTFNPKSPPQVTTSNCEVCTFLGINQASCTSQTSCTPTPTAQPAPVCQVNKAPGGTSVFYLVNSYFSHCTVVGSTQVCAHNFGYGITPKSHWCCGSLCVGADIFGSATAPFSLATEPDPFTVFGSNVCNQGNMVFTKQCDGSYNVVSSGTGGTANCVTSGLPTQLSCTGLDVYIYDAVLVCTGNICT